MHFPWVGGHSYTESPYFVGIVAVFQFRTLPRAWDRSRMDLRLCDLVTWRFSIDFTAADVVRADPQFIRNAILTALSKYDMAADARAEMEAVLA
jgi:hypothetical protein